MRTIIIEDEGAARRRLEGIINKSPLLNLAGSASSGGQAIELLNREEADLLLMDIQLKDMTAFEVLSTIEKDYSGRIIFITAYNDFAVKAFEVFAVDYVLKPYTEERLMQAIERCIKSKSLPGKEVFAILQTLHFPNKICIPEGKTSHLFEKNQIEWIEADGYHSIIHTSDGNEHLIRILLKNICQLLPASFIRISRSIVINKDHVITFKDGTNETYFKLTCGKEFSGKSDYLK